MELWKKMNQAGDKINIHHLPAPAIKGVRELYNNKK